MTDAKDDDAKAKFREALEKKKQGKRMKFRYDPTGKVGKVPEFSFSNISGNQILNENSSEFSSILPLATRVVSQTIAQNLLPVQPLSSMMSQEELDRINNEVKSVNRDGKIESLFEGKEFKEMKPEDHPDWEKLPTSKLFYIDFKYSHKKTRRAGKRHKKK